uniref:Uncharacterized protein n=1 Tax=Salmonella phage vB_SEnST11_KE23 TaxID=3161174 RepID=A0AAU8GG55_9CAUD
MATFKTSINLADAVRRMTANPAINATGDFFVVIDSFDFGLDRNGNTINKYRATLHRGDLVTIQNNYSGCFSLEILTSPKRREQSHNEGQSAALYWLEKIGYDLAYESMTEAPHTKKRAYRHVYRVTNNYLKGL